MTQNTLVAISAFVGLFALMAVRVPIGIGMAIMGVAGYWYLSGRIPALALLAQSPIRNVTDWDLGIIPMFILMGAFATAAGMSREMFRASNAWLGHRRGGLAMATITACAGFAAINGSSVATAATMTQWRSPKCVRPVIRTGSRPA